MNDNEKKNEQNGEEQQQNNAANTQQNEGVKQPEQEKSGFGAWLKKHWKGVTGGLVGTGALVGSAFVAYKKGKAAGIDSCISLGISSVPTQNEDDSLNPNE